MVTRVRGVELEHLEVMRDGETCADVVRELRGFAAVQVSRDSSLGSVAVDRHEGDIHRGLRKLIRKPWIKQRVAGMIERPRPAPDDVAEEAMASRFVRIEMASIRCRWSS